MNAVQIEKVTKQFDGHTAVDDLSLVVPQGSIYGFIGPNGSGKTTTLRMIMNIIYPDCGEIEVFGQRVEGAVVERIGYLPEERGLYRKMKVRELLRFLGEIKCGRRVDEEVDRWLERLGLADWGERKVEALSKGMGQKVQFAAAVVTRPELAVLDEPFSGLDPVNAELLRTAILELKEQGATVIFSTHDMHVAEQLCDSIFMIFRGRKVLDGRLEGIRGEYGRDRLRVRCVGNREGLRGLEGVDEVRDLGQVQELHMMKGADPQAILRKLVTRVQVEQFELASPSLHDIFVSIAGPAAEGEVEDA
ncbi:MAG: ATP-binding cassette domain-containing protein [Gemmatimonadetes bacterium]|nr:ATP-binding cassette domain-containing protein [Gemmatimonadota bacterium]